MSLLSKRGWVAGIAGLLVIAAMFAPLPGSAAPPTNHTIKINSRAFAYEPAEIRVQRGDTITLHLESLDAVHGLYIDGHDVDIQAEPGKSAQATFVAAHEGKFKFRCSVSCGALHPFMIGELTVEPNYPFARAVVATMLATLGAVLVFWK